MGDMACLINRTCITQVLFKTNLAKSWETVTVLIIKEHFPKKSAQEQIFTLIKFTKCRVQNVGDNFRFGQRTVVV